MNRRDPSNCWSVDTAKAALAKAGVTAAVGKTAVTKTRAAAKAPATEPAESPATEATSSTMKAAKAATAAETECAGILGPDREAGDDRCPGQQRAAHLLAFHVLSGAARSLFFVMPGLVPGIHADR